MTRLAMIMMTSWLVGLAVVSAALVLLVDEGQGYGAYLVWFGLVAPFVAIWVVALIAGFVVSSVRSRGGGDPP